VTDQSADENTGHCHVCEEPVTTHDLLGHLRVMHPDEYGDGPITWPDGGVLIEEDLSIEDFTGGAL
jgi:hypothetical protein